MVKTNVTNVMNYVLSDIKLSFSKKNINKAYYPNIFIVLCILYIYFQNNKLLLYDINVKNNRIILILIKESLINESLWIKASVDTSKRYCFWDNKVQLHGLLRNLLP